MRWRRRWLNWWAAQSDLDRIEVAGYVGLAIVGALIVLALM